RRLSSANPGKRELRGSKLRRSRLCQPPDILARDHHQLGGYSQSYVHVLEVHARRLVRSGRYPNTSQFHASSRPSRRIHERLEREIWKGCSICPGREWGSDQL